VKRSRFTESQIVSILRDWDAGAAVAELARKHGVHANTLRLWRAKYGGLEVSDLVKLKQLEDESTRMRRIIAAELVKRFGAGILGDVACIYAAVPMSAG